MTDRGRELAGSAAVVALGLIAGVALGSGWAGLAAGFAAIACRHLYHLIRLADTMEAGMKTAEPLPAGLWRTVYGGAVRLRARSRKRKRRLSRYMSRFRDAAAALPDAAVVIGADGRIEWLNPAATRLLGLALPADAGASLVERVRDPNLAPLIEGDSGGHSTQLRSPVDGSKILAVRAVPFGRKRQRLVVARDVTRTRLVDEAAEDFVASASHELRTPLTVLSGYIEELSEHGPRDEDDAAALAMMRDQADRMTAIVEDLLAFSRLQMNCAPDARAPVRVPEMLDGIVAEARVLGRASEHKIVLDADRSLGLAGDGKQLRSAFSNLVFNAVNHTPPRSEVTVRWWQDVAGAHLSVRDTGVGIAARHIPRLTERFYRVDESRSRATGGTGLGLAIVGHVLEHHGAELRIESAPGSGATFTCHFPPASVIDVEPTGS